MSRGAREISAKMRLRQRTFYMVVLLGLFAGCARRLDPRAAPPVASPDPQAAAEFRRASARFDEGALERADQQFAAFLDHHPDDPLAPSATIYRARIALRRDRPADARALLRPLSRNEKLHPQLRLQARYHLGLAEARSDNHQEATRLLSDLVDRVADPARPALLLALGHAEQQLGNRLTAVALFGELHRITDRPAERAYARRGLDQLIAQALTQAEIDELFARTDRDSVVFAFTAHRLAAIARRAGDTSRAEQILRDHASVLRAHGLEVVASSGAADGPAAIGILLPLRGPYRALGELAMAGAVSGCGLLGDDATARGGPELVFGDSSHDPAAAAAALAKKERVGALVGTFAPEASRAAARVANAQGIPFLSLARDAARLTESRHTLQLMPDNAARARRLAHHALDSAPSTTLAILAPDNRFGRAMAVAFGDAVHERGAARPRVTFYPSRQRSFTDIANRLARQSFTTLFVPDSAARLALLAPALALADLWPTAAGEVPPEGRAISLVATADGITARLVERARRYLQGAILAPGYYPDPTHPRSGALVLAFERAHGHPPALVEALAFDGARFACTHLPRHDMGSAAPRQLLREAPAAHDVSYLTGAFRFGADGSREDPPLLYQVRGDRLVQLH